MLEIEEDTKIIVTMLKNIRDGENDENKRIELNELIEKHILLTNIIINEQNYYKGLNFLEEIKQLRINKNINNYFMSSNNIEHKNFIIKVMQLKISLMNFIYSCC